MRVVGKIRDGPGIDIFEMDMPEPGPNEVLVEVKATGICGTDLHFYYWDEYAKRHNPGFPKVLGHEFSGIVVKVGDNVRTLKIGDKVAAETHIPCGKCYYCRTGRQHICKEMKLYGIDTYWGSFTAYTVLPESVAVKIPEDISYEEAALLEPFGVALHAISAANMSMGDTVLVLGCGPIGIYIQQLARIAGASRVIAAEINTYRIALAKGIGAADEVINPLIEDLVGRVYELTGGEGVNVVIEASGSTQAVRLGLDAVAKNGKFIQVGTTSRPADIDMNTIVYKEVELKGITGRLMFDTWYRAFTIVQSKLINILGVVTHRMALDQAPEAFKLLTKGEAGKILLIP